MDHKELKMMLALGAKLMWFYEFLATYAEDAATVAERQVYADILEKFRKELLPFFHYGPDPIRD